jgi:hypothetical protein
VRRRPGWCGTRASGAAATAAVPGEVADAPSTNTCRLIDELEHGQHAQPGVPSSDTDDEEEDEDVA